MIGNHSTRPISDYLLGDNLENNNKSFNSVLSASSITSNGSSSSKAVLAALRALQDKIRRLESERSLALDEVGQLKLQIKNQELEFEHRKQQDHLNTQKSLQEARAVNDRLLYDKNELEVKSSIVEEKNILLQKQADEFQTKIKFLEEERQQISMKLKELEYHQAHLEQDIKQSQTKEKDMAQSLLWETKRYEEDVVLLQQRIENLQHDIQASSQQKNILEVKLLELDQLVGQLVALNGTLVSQLSGKAPKPTSSSKKVISKKSTKLDGVSSTVTRDLSKAAKSVAAVAKRAILIKTTDDAEHLKHMHKMYTDLARNITRSLTPEKSKVSSSSTQSSSSSSKQKKKALAVSSATENSMQVSRTRMSGKVNSQFSNQGDEIIKRSSSRDHIVPQTVTATGYGDFAEDKRGFPADYSSSTMQWDSTDRAANELEKLNKSDLHYMISTLENEFDALNQQYRSLLSSVQASSSVIPPSTTPDAIQTQAEEIVSVIQKLHQKGEQLRVLRSPSKH